MGLTFDKYEILQDKKENGSGGLWISEAIFQNKKLTNTEKLFIAMIDHLSSHNECFASNEYFGRKLNLSPSRCSDILSSLEKKGIISREFFYGKNGQIEKRVITLTYEGVFGFSGEGTRDSEGGYSENTEDNKDSYNKEFNKEINNKTTNNNIEYIYGNSEKSHSPQDGIFQLLKITDLKESTIKNILKLVRKKNIPTVRVEAVLLYAQEKNWDDGAVYKALKENWTLKSNFFSNNCSSNKTSSPYPQKGDSKKNSQKVSLEYLEGQRRVEITSNLIHANRELFKSIFSEKLKLHNNNPFIAQGESIIELKRQVRFSSP